MKKASIIVILLLILSITGTAFAFNMVNAEKENVTLSEKTVYGDVSATEGLAVSRVYNYAWEAFWDVCHVLGENPATTSDFRFQLLQDKSEDAYTQYIELHSDADRYWDDSDESQASNYFTGIDMAFEDFINEIGTENTGSKTVKLKDYYDYYPISGDYDLLEEYDGWNEPYYLYLQYCMEHKPSYVSYGDKDSMALYEFFNDYFKIPVLDEDIVELNIEKEYNPESDTDELNYWFAFNGYEMETVSVVSDDACYFTFTTLSESGQIVDTSQIKGGYGIYMIPITETASGSNIKTADVMQLSMVYPLDPSEQVFNMVVDENNSHLLLQSAKDGTYYITVIDLDTMKQIQKIDAGKVLPSSDTYTAIRELQSEIACYESCLYAGANYIVTVFNENSIIILAEENGLYQMEASIPIEEYNFRFCYISSMDYRDGKLAICCRFHSDDQTCQCIIETSFDIVVFDRSKLLYMGNYADTLSTSTDQIYDLYSDDDLILHADTPLISWS